MNRGDNAQRDPSPPAQNKRREVRVDSTQNRSYSPPSDEEDTPPSRMASKQRKDVQTIDQRITHLSPKGQTNRVQPTPDDRPNIVKPERRDLSEIISNQTASHTSELGGSLLLQEAAQRARWTHLQRSSNRTSTERETKGGGPTSPLRAPHPDRQ
ncbi:hypothetical protein PROFUN_14464 [Planoprotostelium fungivorum]|uniref:Uncharacterized protein n=1 Tax=Planoprotostelium fungivorum TaxID=1890364 RepID=A0A2P6MXA7_9EUKA|nr:hypothetical protein PROFUN_14464 [Planoprotostelium fungivorum]